MATGDLEEKLFVIWAHSEPVLNQAEINSREGDMAELWKALRQKQNQTMDHVSTQYEPKQRHNMNYWINRLFLKQVLDRETGRVPGKICGL